MKLRNVLSAHKRIAITGAPGTGKTTITRQVTDRPVIHTDDWMDQPWTDVPALIKAKCEETPEAFVVEGVQVPRTLRKGLDVDAVVYLSAPLEHQTPAQIALGKGLTTTLREWAATHPNVPIITDLTLDSLTMKRRFIKFTLDAATFTPTPQGGRRYRATATMAGVFEYNRPGEGVVREYRPAEEIKKALASLKGAPVVLLHPQVNGGEVDVSNAKELSCGHFEDPVWNDATNSACGYVVINDAAALETIDNWIALTGGVDISCGYDNEREMTPGVSPKGEPYHLVQRNYVFNHVAIGPRGWGRQGPDVGLTLDSDDNEEDPMKVKTKDQADPVEKKDEDITKDNETSLTPEDIAALKSLVAIAPLLNRLVNSGQTSVELDNDDEPEMRTLDTEEDPEKRTLDNEQEDPEKRKTLDSKDLDLIERIAAEGAAVRTRAAKLLGDGYNYEGKTTRTVRVDVIRTLDSAFDPRGKTDREVKTAYQLALKALEKQGDYVKQLRETRVFDQFTLDSNTSDSKKPVGHDIYD